MSASYQKFGGFLGIIAGFAGLVYLAAFLASKNPAAPLPALALLVVSLAASAAVVALYHRVRATDEGFALWGLLLAAFGAGGAAVHAAFDLANNAHPPAAPFAYANPIDPRGFLTFAISGLGVIVLAWLTLRGAGEPAVLPRWLGYLGLLSGVLLVTLYVAYMLILNALNPIVLALILASGLCQPAWYLCLGYGLWRNAAAAMRPQRAGALR